MMKMLTILFIYLKLTNQITWSCFWVLLPLIVYFFTLLIVETRKSLIKQKSDIAKLKEIIKLSN